MLKTETIILETFGNRKLDYFSNLGYDTSGDTFIIKVEHLNVGSRKKVDVECDFCQKLVNITYKEYLRNISIGGKYACSKECGYKKAEEKNLMNIGVSHPMKLKENQEKARKTNFKKYGVEYLMQSEEMKLRSRISIMKKYEVDHISKSDYFKKEFKKTCLKNNGVEYPMMNSEIREKSRNKLLKNWGFDNPSKSKEIQNKIKFNNVIKYGVEHTSKLEEVKLKVKCTKLHRYGNENYNNIEKIKEKINKLTSEDWIIISEKAKKTKLHRYGNENYNNIEKIKETISFFTEEDWKKISENRKLTSIDKYGEDNISKNESFRSVFKICKDENYIKYLSKSESLFYCENGHNFIISTDNHFHRSKSNLPLCTICYPIGDKISIREKEIYEFIKSIYKGEIIQSHRDDLEIDIYLPHLKLGFEFNGLYWHSEEFKDKWYHLNKTNHFKERGIRIIHIWEDDWLFREDIIKSQIKNWLGLNNIKISARKCVIREIDNAKIFRKFLDSNHIQGYSHSVIKLGLFYNGELVSLMTFEQSEGRERMPENEWNLSRFCNKLNTSVIGGASKLLIYFIKTYKPSRIISYADKDWSTGYLYEKLGFKNIKESRPDYKYIIDNRRVNKSRYRKSKLNTTLSESKEMKFRNIQKIWDCGKIKFELILNFNLN
jgi:hypothetical protein